MKSRHPLYFGILLLAVVALALPQDALGLGHKKKAVSHAVEHFYSALNAVLAGQSGPMDEVWSHDEKVTYMGADGKMSVGWQAVSAVWDAAAAMKLGGEVEPGDLQVTVSGDLAIVRNYEMGRFASAGGEAREFKIRATNVFRKTGGEWMMISHHSDPIENLRE